VYMLALYMYALYSRRMNHRHTMNGW